MSAHIIYYDKAKVTAQHLALLESMVTQLFPTGVFDLLSNLKTFLVKVLCRQETIQYFGSKSNLIPLATLCELL